MAGRRRCRPRSRSPSLRCARRSSSCRRYRGSSAASSSACRSSSPASSRRISRRRSSPPCWRRRSPTRSSIAEASVHRLDLVLADHFPPARNLASEKCLSGLRRALILRIRRNAGSGPALYSCRIIKQRLERAVQLLDHRRGRSRRRKERVPVLDLELRSVELDQAWYAGKLRVGFLRRDAVSLELAGSDQREHRLRRGEEEVDVVAHHVLQRGCRSEEHTSE